MTIPHILILAGIVIIVIALLARRSGPRVTQITRTRTHVEDDGDA